MIFKKSTSTIFFSMLFWLCVNSNLAFGAEQLQSKYSSTANGQTENLLRIRMGTLTGKPPFGFLDTQNRLSGLYVDLARRICDQLVTVPTCEIQAVSVNDANTSLQTGVVDAVIGTILPTKENRSSTVFSRTFFRDAFYRISSKQKSPTEQVGILKGSFSQQASNFLSSGKGTKPFDNYNDLFSSLSSGDIKEAVVATTAAQFWILSETSNSCCSYSGPIYISSSRSSIHRIATNENNPEVHKLIETALHALEISGSLDELRKRYFPLSIAK